MPAEADETRQGAAGTSAQTSAQTSVRASARVAAPDPAEGDARSGSRDGERADGKREAHVEGRSGGQDDARVDGRPGGRGGEQADAEPTVHDPISAPDAAGRPRRATRRFPLFTRDTARPEGGGRAAPGDAPAPARQWPILAVLIVVGLGLLLTALDQFRVGTILIGAALLAGAVMRWMLPSVGMLAVRSRFTDIATYGVLGLAIVLLALMAQPNPWLVIPFLKGALHFSVSG